MNTQRTLFVALLLLVACGREPQSADTPESSTTSSKLPQTGGELVVALGSEPASLNPVTAQRSGAFILGLLHRGLFQMNGELEYDPALADRWGWSEDAMTLDVHLRDDLRWSDGTAFTAEHVVRSFQIYDHPDAPFDERSLLDPLREVVPIDPQHIRFQFDAITTMRLRHANLDPLPVHVVGDRAPAEMNSWPIQTEPVTLGPFRLKSWRRGIDMILERNPHFYGAPPYLDTIRVKFIGGETDQLMQLEAGDVDFVTDVPAHEVPRLEADHRVRVLSVPGRQLSFIILNLQNPVFEDRRVRQALSHAIDRNALVESALAGRGTAAGALLPPVLWSHHDGLSADAYDPEHAALLLTEAGWVDSDDDGTRDKDGVELEFRAFSMANDPAREAVAELVRQNLSAVGVTARNSFMGLGGLIGKMQSRDFDALTIKLGSPLFTDLSSQIATGGMRNPGGYSNPRVDELLPRALEEVDRAEAVRLWRQVQEIVHEDKPIIMLYYPDQLIGVGARVRDAVPNHVTPFANVEKWWIAE